MRAWELTEAGKRAKTFACRWCKKEYESEMGKFCPHCSRFQDLNEEDKLELPDIEVGDELKIGKFKNRKAEVKGFKKDKHNHPVAKTTKGDVQLLKPRVTKLEPEKVKEGFKVDPATIDVTIDFDPETVTKDEFNEMLGDIQHWKNRGVMSWAVNDKEVEDGFAAAAEMKKLIQHRVDAAKKEEEKWEKHTWEKNFPNAEMIPVWWLKKLKGNALRTDMGIKANIGYNPDTDDWDRGSLEDLADSLKKRGIQEPVVIIVGYRDGYAYIGEGNHRIVAAEMAGINKLPARIHWYREAGDKRDPGQYTHDVSDDLMFNIGEQQYSSKPSEIFKSLAKGHKK